MKRLWASLVKEDLTKNFPMQFAEMGFKNVGFTARNGKLRIMIHTPNGLDESLLKFVSPNPVDILLDKMEIDQNNRKAYERYFLIHTVIQPTLMDADGEIHVKLESRPYDFDEDDVENYKKLTQQDKEEYTDVWSDALTYVVCSTLEKMQEQYDEDKKKDEK